MKKERKEKENRAPGSAYAATIETTCMTEEITIVLAYTSN